MRKAGTSKTKNPVPRLASALLSLFTPFENRASILGDYEGMFDDLARRRGRLAARAFLHLSLDDLPLVSFVEAREEIKKQLPHTIIKGKSMA